MKSDLILLFGCFGLGVLGAVLMSRFGHILLSMDYPKERSSHFIPVPRGGGIGILAAFVLTGLVLRVPLNLWLPVSCLSLFGFVMDKKELPAVFRLLIQFAIVCWMVTGLALPLTGIGRFVLFIFFVIYIAGTANFYNFMDGINGIAGLTGMAAFSLLALFAGLQGLGYVFSVLCFSLVFACAGFLPWNMPKARVFMGDGGSLLLGSAFAWLTVLVSKNALDFITAAAFLFPFYADEAVTMFLRIRQGDDLTQSHRKHLYQILANEMGISHWKISVVYALFQFIIGGSVLLMRPRGFFFVLGLLLFDFALFIVLNIFLRGRIQNPRRAPVSIRKV